MKTLMISALGLFMLSLVSCKKDYACVCEAVFDGEQVGATGFPITNTTKKDAEESCDTHTENFEEEYGGTGITVTCELTVE